jgi:hypothetical protein
LLTTGLAIARLRTCGAGPSTALRFAQDDGNEEELALVPFVALDASLRSFASLRMTAIVVGGNEKAQQMLGFPFAPESALSQPKGRGPLPEAWLKKEKAWLFCAGPFLFLLVVEPVLLGGHFFGFAFLTHHFEFAFCFLEGRLYFLLDLGCRFFELR